MSRSSHCASGTSALLERLFCLLERPCELTWSSQSVRASQTDSSVARTHPHTQAQTDWLSQKCFSVWVTQTTAFLQTLSQSVAQSVRSAAHPLILAPPILGVGRLNAVSIIALICAECLLEFQLWWVKDDNDEWVNDEGRNGASPSDWSIVLQVGNRKSRKIVTEPFDKWVAELIDHCRRVSFN